MAECVHLLPGEEMAPGSTMGRRQAGRCSVMLYVLLGPGINVDVVTLTCTSYLNSVADQVHPFIAMVFFNGSGLFQQDAGILLFLVSVHEDIWV